ncbi:hypothetical protein BV20DRAFT_541884 [Pilatotrama ljubarskyi]|nr:hypothetical protein BV20DRAFT_541884 [Pilatotrama ljubarskyi]
MHARSYTLSLFPWARFLLDSARLSRPRGYSGHLPIAHGCGDVGSEPVDRLALRNLTQAQAARASCGSSSRSRSRCFLTHGYRMYERCMYTRFCHGLGPNNWVIPASASRRERRLQVLCSSHGSPAGHGPARCGDAVKRFFGIEDIGSAVSSHCQEDKEVVFVTLSPITGSMVWHNLMTSQNDMQDPSSVDEVLGDGLEGEGCERMCYHDVAVVRERRTPRAWV